MIEDVTKSKISNSQHTSLEVKRELKEVREAFVSTLCDPEEEVCIKGSGADREILQQALATLDRTLNQLADNGQQLSSERTERDEAELVNKVINAICYEWDIDWYGTAEEYPAEYEIPSRSDIRRAAKAALRAVGLIPKEGE